MQTNAGRLHGSSGHLPRAALIALALSTAIVAPTNAQQPRPKIDMHLHPTPWFATEIRDTADLTAGAKAALAEMDRQNIVLALGSGPVDAMRHWRNLAPDRVVAGVLFPCDRGWAANGGRQCFADGDSLPDLDWLRGEIEAGRVGFLGEITTQYLGLHPDHPMMRPYYALAEELDVPVAIHMGDAPAGAAYPNRGCGANPCSRRYRAAMGDALLLEDLLTRHPRLRVYVQHAGWPLKDRMMALLYQHPQVHVDVAAIGFAMGKKAYHRYVCELVENGFGKRMFWGTDAGPNGYASTIDLIESAECLTEENKADIFHGNAARFLGR